MYQKLAGRIQQGDEKMQGIPTQNWNTWNKAPEAAKLQVPSGKIQFDIWPNKSMYPHSMQPLKHEKQNGGEVIFAKIL